MARSRSRQMAHYNRLLAQNNRPALALSRNLHSTTEEVPTMSAVQMAKVENAVAWVDGKRWLWLLSPAMPLLGLASVLAVAAGAPGALLWALPLVFYGL